MSYQALYRKYRPKDFSSVRGQEHIVKTLTNQIQADRIGHAYLFCGEREEPEKRRLPKFLQRQ